MQEEKKPFEVFTQQFEITKDVMGRDKDILQYEKNRKASDLGIAAGQYFGFEKIGESQETEKYAISLVVMTNEEFDRLREIEWMYNDLCDDGEEE